MDIRGSVTWVLRVQAVRQLDSLCVVVILPSHCLSYQLTASNGQTHVVALAVRQAVCVGKAAGVLGGRLEAGWSHQALQKGEQQCPKQGVPRGEDIRQGQPSLPVASSHPSCPTATHTTNMSIITPDRKTSNCLSEVQPLMSSLILREAWGGA